MRKQVLILNITRMGDLVQTVPLLARLEQEWPGVAIDLAIDTRLAPVAALLPGLRQVLTYDFHDFRKTPRPAPGAEMLSPELTAWARSLAAVGYDRVINLTFTHWSGLLAAAIGASDTRGVTVSQNGATLLQNPWLTQVVDLHQHRRLNRFNLVDLYTLGGSGPGVFTPIQLQIPAEVEQWARQFVQARIEKQVPVAVQVGASHPIKAWRPELFGRAMAALSHRLSTAFILIGTEQERASVQQAVKAYHEAGGVGLLCDAVGQTGIPQLAALLRECRLLLTSDTGPMHLAVGVGTPVIDLSVGHADFHETGPHGPGHWVVQPVMECSPCSYQQVCAHHSCKDQIVPEQLAALASHIVGEGSFPATWSAVQVYESDIDADGLACYRLRAGESDAVAEWYGTFWRRYWYERFTGQVSCIDLDGPAPDHAKQQQLFSQQLPALNRAVELADQIAEGSRQQPMPLAALRHAQTELTNLRNRIMPLALSSPACGPLAVSLMRQLSQCETSEVMQVADHQARAYETWMARMYEVQEGLHRPESQNRDSFNEAFGDGQPMTQHGEQVRTELVLP